MNNNDFKGVIMKTLKQLLAIALIAGSFGSSALGMETKKNELKPVVIATFRNNFKGANFTYKAYSQESLKNATAEELCANNITVHGIHDLKKCSKSQEHLISIKNESTISDTFEKLYPWIMDCAASASKRSIVTLVSYECEKGYEFDKLLAGTFPKSKL